MLVTSCTKDVRIPDIKTLYNCTGHCNDGGIDTILPSSAPIGSKRHYRFDDATINDKTLSVDLEAGSCVEHCWELIWRGEIFPLDDSTAWTIFAMSHCTDGTICEDSTNYSLNYDIQFLDELDTTGRLKISLQQDYWMTDSVIELQYIH